MKRPKLLLAILASMVLLDQATKYLAHNFIDPFSNIRVLPFLNLVNVENVGAAFGLFASFGNTAFIVINVLAVALIAFLIVREKEGLIPLTLILSGAVGNLVDRLAFGYVRDFIDFHAAGYHWPAFNVADSALTVGIILMLAGSIFPARKAKITQ